MDQNENDFIGVGRYFYEDGKCSIDLGICRSQEDINTAVINIGTLPTEGDWEVQPDQDLLRAVFAATSLYSEDLV